MQVVAFATPASPDWRWRIVDYGGQMVEESYQSFPTIALAVEEGARRLHEMSNASVAPHTISYSPGYRVR